MTTQANKLTEKLLKEFDEKFMDRGNYVYQIEIRDFFKNKLNFVINKSIKENLKTIYRDIETNNHITAKEFKDQYLSQEWIDKWDAEIMWWFYDQIDLLFEASVMIDSTDIRKMLKKAYKIAFQSGLTAGREEAIKKVNKLLNEEAQKENSIFLENAITFLKSKLEALTQKE